MYDTSSGDTSRPLLSTFTYLNIRPKTTPIAYDLDKQGISQRKN